MSATSPGFAARRDEKNTVKYRSLSDRFMVEPESVETSSVLLPRSISPLTAIGVEIDCCSQVRTLRVRVFVPAHLLAIIRGKAIFPFVYSATRNTFILVGPMNISKNY